MGRNRRWLIAVTSILIGCSRGVYHRVQPGETLYRISKAYGVSVAELSRANKISDPSRIEVGQELRIPDATKRVPVDVVAPRTANSHCPSTNLALDSRLDWPLDGGTLTSSFGKRGNNTHDGIDISAPVGTMIHAASAGEVVYSDSLRGYGNVIIVRHDNGYATVYAHNNRNLVQAGKHVRRGETIAQVGQSGHTTGANLHFEVRKDNVACDPLFFLPPSKTVSAPRDVDAGG